jgi:hypothetical protein
VGGRGIYKKPLEPTQRPTNPYIGWATPPTNPSKTAGFTMWRHFNPVLEQGTLRRQETAVYNETRNRFTSKNKENNIWSAECFVKLI